jgi:hypothetical protein
VAHAFAELPPAVHAHDASSLLRSRSPRNPRNS